jgi:hypothetical protein
MHARLTLRNQILNRRTAMNLDELTCVCNTVFPARGSEQKTGAVGHLKEYPINGNGQKTLFVAQQGTKFSSDTAETSKVVGGASKIREVSDCREHVTTKRNRGEWTGYHAEMIIVSAWLKLLNLVISTNDLGHDHVDQFKTAFERLSDCPLIVQAGLEKMGSPNRPMIVANAPCCLHCHNMLTFLSIEHPVPADPKQSLTGWWNPLTDKSVPNHDFAGAGDIPGMQ